LFSTSLKTFQDWLGMVSGVAIRLRIHPDSAAVAMGDPAANRQAGGCARLRLLAVRSLKYIKDSLVEFWINANAIVAGRTYPFMIGAPCTHVDVGCLAIMKFDGIRFCISSTNGEQSPTTGNSPQVILAFDTRMDASSRWYCRRPYENGYALKRPRAGVNAGILEQVMDQGLHLLCRLHCALDPFIGLRG
jgi:hypothetical protein